MTYDEFSKKQKQILDECKSLIKELKLEEFNEKMEELTALQDSYLVEQKEKRIKSVQPTSDVKIVMNKYKLFYKGDLRQVFMSFLAESDEKAIERFKAMNASYLVLYRMENNKKKYKLEFTQTLKY